MTDAINIPLDVRIAKRFESYCERVNELERQLVSARSIAVDRDQRLARIAELVDWKGWVCMMADGVLWAQIDAVKEFQNQIAEVARGEEEHA